MVATITLNYTQSNSVCYAKDGQVRPTFDGSHNNTDYTQSNSVCYAKDGQVRPTFDGSHNNTELYSI